jgi:hypothetical protein
MKVIKVHAPFPYIFIVIPPVIVCVWVCVCVCVDIALSTPTQAPHGDLESKWVQCTHVTVEKKNICQD